MLFFRRPRTFRQVMPDFPPGQFLASHRGYGKKGPLAENTLPAFLASASRGFFIHELDVRSSADGVVILFHGPLLSSTTSGPDEKLEKFTFSQLQNFNFAHYLPAAPPQGPTTLEAYLQQMPASTFTNIELKRDRGDFSGKNEKQTALVVRKLQAEKRVFFSSFNLLSLFYMRRLLPECGLGLLYEPGLLAGLRLWLQRLLLQPDFIHMPKAHCHAENMRRLKKKGYGLVIWTVNDPEQAQQLFSLGADIVITDNIEMLKMG